MCENKYFLFLIDNGIDILIVIVISHSWNKII